MKYLCLYMFLDMLLPVIPKISLKRSAYLHGEAVPAMKIFYTGHGRRVPTDEKNYLHGRHVTASAMVRVPILSTATLFRRQTSAKSSHFWQFSREIDNTRYSASL